jgi:hypothetical protein
MHSATFEMQFSTLYKEENMSMNMTSTQSFGSQNLEETAVSSTSSQQDVPGATTPGDDLSDDDLHESVAVLAYN